MTNSVSIIDYGVGNLLSVTRAFNHFDVPVKFINTNKEISEAQRLVLPGVGAFSIGMKSLKELNLIDSIKKFVESGKPFLGICLGMQMMMTKSFEFGEHEGLDLIKGNVIGIPKKGKDGKPHKIPHIGWNELIPYEQSSNWDDSILKNIQKNTSVYFVHSFMATPEIPNNALAYTLYNDQPICAAIKDNNIYGCQFHPEKSGPNGLKIIKQFLQI